MTHPWREVRAWCDEVAEIDPAAFNALRRTAGEPGDVDGRVCRGDGDIVRDGVPMTVTCTACRGRGCGV